MTGSRTAAQNQALGAYGESVAARHLTQQKGMVLLDRNWRCDAGEIDLVLRDGSVLVVCEVKTRSSLAVGHPHEAVTPAKVARLTELGVRWQQAHGVLASDLRVDVVSVIRPRRGAATVDHVRGVV